MQEGEHPCPAHFFSIARGVFVANAIETHQITKVFGDNVANDHINLSVVDGHIHAILGENGAGKTTLMKILFGEVKPTEGTINIFGKQVEIVKPADALKHSIGFIHQHFTLVNEYTIGQNYALSIEPTKGVFFSDYEKVNKKVKEILEMLEMPLDLKAPVGSFSVEERQIIEIGKALYRGARILILDEPTSVLTPQKIAKLLDILKVLRKEGKTIIIITHKLDEALAIADEITVLRHGKLVASLPRTDVTKDQLVRMMVGDEPLVPVEKTSHSFGDALLQVRDLSVDVNGSKTVRDVSFEVKKGEIFGLTGVGGNGQAELVEAIIGMRPLSSGSLIFAGQSIGQKNIRQRRLSGMAYVPENRMSRGVSLALPVSDNLIMGHHYRDGFRTGPILRSKKIREYATSIIEQYEVATTSLDLIAGSLSGGNMQKLIIGREFSMNTPFMIVAYPSQGVDIRTTKYIHSEMLRRRDAGCAILLVSGDLDEIFALSDRIGVMYSGELVAITQPEETNRFELGEYMLGSRRKSK
jgi:general nucleoside transport system ATP-binding protein